MDANALNWSHYPQVALCTIARTFVETLLKQHYSLKTLDAYARNLDDLYGFMTRTLSISREGQTTAAAQVEQALLAAGPDLLDEYQADLYAREPQHRRRHVIYLSGTGLSINTIQQRIVTARRFYEWCIFHGLRPDTINPVPRGSYDRRSGRGRPGPIKRRVEVDPWIPTDIQWHAIVQYLLCHESLRNQVLILVAYEGALRRQEVTKLRLDDVNWRTNIITIRPEVSKNGLRRSVPISSSTSELLRSYIETDRRRLLQGFGGEVHGPLFLSESLRNAGQPLAIGAFNDVIERLRQQLTLPQLHPHTLRHLRAHILYRAGVDLQDIKLFLGHKDIQSTAIYLRLLPQASAHLRKATAPFDAFIEQAIQHAGVPQD